MLADRRGWAFDKTARALQTELKDRLELSLAYVAEAPRIACTSFDFIYVFWWGETYHLKQVAGKVPIIKEVSSDRWCYEKRYQVRDDAEAIRRYMSDADGLIATSANFARRLKPHHSAVFEYRLGVDGACFYPGPQACPGPLSIGWVGRATDAAKNYREVFVPAVRHRSHVCAATGDLTPSEMPDFYRKLDVICVTSKSEGTPLPLLEAMASGCFPISTRVGVAEEVIVDGVNGLLIDPTPKSLRRALAWCDANVALVREAGLQNSATVREEWSWKRSANLLLSALENMPILKASSTRVAPSYKAHFDRINPGRYSEEVFKAQCIAFEEELTALLPDNKNAAIVEVGPGYGHLVRWLASKGYSNLLAVERDEGLADGLREHGVLSPERVIAADARQWFREHEGKVDLVVLCDVIEHLNHADGRELLECIHHSLNVGGRVWLRTPNMANVLGAYSRYIDLTHEVGYTEWSVLALLEQAGFNVTGLLLQPRYGSRLRQVKAKLQRWVHLLLYRLDERTVPQVSAKNLVAWGQR
jgi:2-polyprenyl-3-methyl-5-hydroxy-6-metoxy-1,4-benzoquinol methylase